MSEQSIVDLIRPVPESRQPGEILDLIKECRNEFIQEGGSHAKAALALVNSESLRRSLVSPEDIRTFDRIVRSASDKITQLTTQPLSAQSIFAIVRASSEKGHNNE